MKSRLQGAQKGHGLLKKKADALQMRFRLILKKIIDVNCWLMLCLIFSCFLKLCFVDQDPDGWCDERGCVFPSRNEIRYRRHQPGCFAKCDQGPDQSPFQEGQRCRSFKNKLFKSVKIFIKNILFLKIHYVCSFQVSICPSLRAIKMAVTHTSLQVWLGAVSSFQSWKRISRRQSPCWSNWLHFRLPSSLWTRWSKWPTAESMP